MPHLRCEKCDDFYLLRDGAAGIFLAASQFPKHRETRAPTVEEIVEVKDKLDPKYRYLADAPVKSTTRAGPPIVRFARKTKEQYVTSEQDGKTTGWRAHFRGREVGRGDSACEARFAQESEAARTAGTAEEGGCPQVRSPRKKAAAKKKARARRQPPRRKRPAD